MTLLLKETEVEQVLGFDDLPEAIRRIETAYRQKAAGQATVHPRVTVQYPPGEGYYNGNCLRLLVGMLPEMDSVALRAYPHFREHEVAERGPRVLDRTTGQEILAYYRYKHKMQLTALMSHYRIMNVRTAAPTGLATSLLARPDSHVLGVIGAGRHAAWQIAAVCAVRPIKEVRITCLTAEHRERLAEELVTRLAVPVRAVASNEAAVAGADVVITVTNANQPVIDGGWLSPGAHVNVIARGECDEATILRADRIACSWREQILRDTPEFRPVGDMLRQGKISEERFHDLDEFILNPLLGRQDDNEITLFLSQGVGIWDAAVAGWVYQRAVSHGLGTEFSFSWKD